MLLDINFTFKKCEKEVSCNVILKIFDGELLVISKEFNDMDSYYSFIVPYMVKGNRIDLQTGFEEDKKYKAQFEVSCLMEHKFKCFAKLKNFNKLKSASGG